MSSSYFLYLLDDSQRKAWDSFNAVVLGYLGNHRDVNHVAIVEGMLNNYKEMGCRMSLKVHVLHANLNEFRENMGAYSEKQGEKVHQDIASFEQRYQGVCDEQMLGDYIWRLVRDSDLVYERKSRKTSHF